jgi:membrane-bound metal-dependent hydrolase YbcI (DUF457 family)
MDPIAHASIAFIARPAAPRAHPLVLIAATQVPDLSFFAFEAAGLEHQAVTRMDFRRGLTCLSPAHIPWSHGLTACSVWSAVAGAVVGATTATWSYRDRCTGAIIGSLVFSHWVLDAIAYNNLPVVLDDSPEVGLGLVTTGAGVIAGMLVEAALITGGVATFLRNRKGTTPRSGQVR